MNITENDLVNAFKKNNPAYLRKVHLMLNRHYYNLVYNQNENHAIDPEVVRRFKQIECVWIEHEKSECLNRYDCSRRINNAADIVSALREHPVFNHAIFHYLRCEATLEDVKIYILNDSVLNLEFFDYLSLSIVGVSGIAKAEIIKNMWEEAGRGNIEEFHTTQFKKIMHSLGLHYKRDVILENMTWEGLSGINLFSHLSLYSYNKMKYFGLMAATEMLDPTHYHLLIQALDRVQKSQHIEKQYYIEHESIDVVHAAGWINNVILPMLEISPDKVGEFWLGFYLRLDSLQRYYDRMLEQFHNKKAA